MLFLYALSPLEFILPLWSKLSAVTMERCSRVIDETPTPCTKISKTIHIPPFLVYSFKLMISPVVKFKAVVAGGIGGNLELRLLVKVPLEAQHTYQLNNLTLFGVVNMVNMVKIEYLYLTD